MSLADTILELREKGVMKKDVLAILNITDHRYYRELQGKVEPVAKVEPNYVYRQPCFKCGVRADIGCRHQVSA